jgi:hypothetical protein
MNASDTTTSDAAHRPAVTARCAVVTATAVLPRGPLRSRYRQELLAELYFIDGSAQFRFSVGILLRAWALRRALTEEGTVFHDTMPHTPVPCRLNLHHQYQMTSTEDGSRFRRCRRCGKDDPRSGSGPGDWAAPITWG